MVIISSEIIFLKSFILHHKLISYNLLYNKNYLFQYLFKYKGAKLTKFNLFPYNIDSLFKGDNMFNQNNAFSSEITPSIMSFDTLQKARKDLIGEIQAVIDYDSHIHTTNDKLARNTWNHIKEEELVHIGELLALLNYLDPSQIEFVQKGFNEFYEHQS